jgi:predicted enzyme related to lactoylglutathione lyase
MADAPNRGQFVWHELMTTDTKSAAAFFTKVIGWKTQPWAEDPSYSMFATDRPMAGLMALPAEAKAMGTKPCWMCYISCPNVDDTARQAVGLGGKILKQPADIPTIGRFAVIADPQGAVFQAFTPLPTSSPMPAPPARAPIGDFSWHELTTTDWRGALAFYKNLFGWQETSAMDMGPEMGTYQMFGVDGKVLGGMMNKPKQMPGPPAWMPYIHVKDVKKVAASVKRQGGQVVNGPMEVPGGDWIVQGVDLQGAMFAVHSIKADAAAVPPPAQKAAAKPVRKAAKKAAKKTIAKKATTAAPKKKAAKAKKKAKAPAARRAVKKSARKAVRRRR